MNVKETQQFNFLHSFGYLFRKQDSFRHNPRHNMKIQFMCQWLHTIAQDHDSRPAWKVLLEQLIHKAMHPVSSGFSFLISCLGLWEPNT